MKKLIALLMALAICISLVACAGSEEETKTTEPAGAEGTEPAGTEATEPAVAEPKYGGHLNARTTSGLAYLDPLKTTGSWNYQWTTAVWEPFITRDSDYNICPSVCDFELSEDKLDLKLWPREGYIFSHGYGQVDMDDIVASWNRGVTLYSNCKKFVGAYTEYAQVETIDGKEVFHVKFTEYNEKTLYYLATYRTWFVVMPKEICEKYPEEYIKDQMEDCVGTGPYIVTEYEEGVKVTISKRDDYVPVDNSMYSDIAGTKYGYLDSMTFWKNSNDASAATALLAGDYDCTEVLPLEYMAMAEEEGITLTKLPSDQRCWMHFNSYGTNNVTAKYPSLRKAIMAAIDYASFLEIITDDSYIMEGDTITLLEKYDLTEKFKATEWYGEANLEVAAKYLEEARAAGYGDEPVQIVVSNTRNDVPVMLSDAMKEAGIPYEVVQMESNALSEFRGDPENNWDCFFTWGVTGLTPGLIQDSVIKNYWNNPEKEELRAQLLVTDCDSEEYLQIWEQIVDMWVEDCATVYMSAIDWWWWHPDTLHFNDAFDGNDVQRYMFNAYWEDPENHPKKQ